MNAETTKTKSPDITTESFALILAELPQDDVNLLAQVARKLTKEPWIRAGASSPEDYEQNLEAYAERLARSYAR